MAKMTDDELLAVTGNEIRNSVGYRTGKLSESRRKALQYYLARPVGDLAPPEIEGRSSVVSTDVADTINWMLPSLMKVFLSGDTIVEMSPRKPEDEPAAKIATDVCEYIIHQQNDGYNLIQTWFLDAMLSKNGIIKVWWDTRKTETKERYSGLTDIELKQLMDDEEVEVTEHTSYVDEEDQESRRDAIEHITQQATEAMQHWQPQPPQPAQPPPSPMDQAQQAIQAISSKPPVMLHDVTCVRSQAGGKVKIDNVPPEEFLISRDARSLPEARFCAHQFLRSISELRSMGYKNVDDLQNDDTQAMFSPERVERTQINDEMGWMSGINDTPGDPSSRRLWVSECYMQVDADGDGIAEWMKITRAGNTILDSEECDGPPFVDIVCVKLAHTAIGLSLADLTMEIQRQKTAVQRAVFDNLYLSVNRRMYAVEGQVNLDDLLTSRPGGVVRIAQQGAVGPLSEGMPSLNEAQSVLEYLETQKENRTGWTRYSQGLNPDAIDSTATGVNVMTNRGDLRMELIARNFAEGFKRLTWMVVKLLSQHQDKEMTVRVAGEWVDVDPRIWKNQYDYTINAGLGTGNKDQQVQHMMMLMQVQQQGMQIGMATPSNIYNAATKLANALGYRNGDAFFTDPGKNQHQQPPSNEMMQLQGQQQMAQAKLQADMQMAKDQAQLDMQKFQAQAQIEAESKHQDRQAEIQKQAAQLQAQYDIAQMQTQSALQSKQMETTSRQQEKMLELAAGILAAQYSAGLSGDAEHPVNLVDGTQLDQTAQAPGVTPAHLTDMMQQVEQMASALAPQRTQGSMFVSPSVRPEPLVKPKTPAKPFPHEELMNHLRNLTAVLSAPKQIVRDQSGKPVGITHVLPDQVQ
jgi:hypothetical protein